MDNQNNFNANGWDQSNTPASAPQGAPNYVPQGAPNYAPQGAPNYAPQGAPNYAPQGAPAPAPQGAPSPAPQGGKNKKMIIIIAVAAIVVIAGIVCAIIFLGGDKSDSKKSNDGSTTQVTTEKELTKEEKIVGEWTATMDFTEKFMETEGIKEVKDKFDKDFKFVFDIVFKFEKDGSFTMEIDEDSLVDLKANLKKGMEPVILALLRESDSKYASLTDQQLKDELKNVLGKDFDAYMDEIIKEFDVSSMAEENLKGKYQIGTDKITFTSDQNKESDKENYLAYKFINNDKMEVTEFVVNGENSDEFIVTPFTMEKSK